MLASGPSVSSRLAVLVDDDDDDDADDLDDEASEKVNNDEGKFS